MHAVHATLALTGGLLAVIPLAAQNAGTSMKPQEKAETFTATLTGASEVPAVNTTGSGTVRFTVRNDSTIAFEVTLTGVPDVTAAHIHLGKAGANGSPVVTLLKGAEPGGMAHGTITPKDLHGTTMSQLLAAMKSGGAYVNVHTKAHPGGELRGEIEAAVSTGMSLKH